MRSPRELSPEELQREVDSRHWFHTIDLGRGVRTRGHKDTPTEVHVLGLPDDLTGRTVLDIGTYDGFYAFEAERRGAARVVATDSWTWNWPGSDARRNFELAHDVLASKVEPLEISVEELSPERVGGTFDIVLFLGVLYHAPNPIGYLHNVLRVTAGMVIIETLVDLLDVAVPAAAYYPGDLMNGDASNHFGPNALAVEGLLASAGFSRSVAFPPWQSNRRWGLEYAFPTPWRRLPIPRRLRRAPRSGRMVFHAWP